MTVGMVSQDLFNGKGRSRRRDVGEVESKPPDASTASGAPGFAVGWNLNLETKRPKKLCSVYEVDGD